MRVTRARWWNVVNLTNLATIQSHTPSCCPTDEREENPSTFSDMKATVALLTPPSCRSHLLTHNFTENLRPHVSPWTSDWIVRLPCTTCYDRPAVVYQTCLPQGGASSYLGLLTQTYLTHTHFFFFFSWDWQWMSQHYQETECTWEFKKQNEQSLLKHRSKELVTPISSHAWQANVYSNGSKLAKKGVVLCQLYMAF